MNFENESKIIQLSLYKHKKDIISNPNDALAYYYIGVICNEGKRYNELLKCIKNAIRICPEYAGFHVTRGNILKGLDKKKKQLWNAIKKLSELVQIMQMHTIV